MAFSTFFRHPAALHRPGGGHGFRFCEGRVGDKRRLPRALATWPRGADSRLPETRRCPQLELEDQAGLPESRPGWSPDRTGGGGRPGFAHRAMIAAHGELLLVTREHLLARWPGGWEVALIDPRSRPFVDRPRCQSRSLQHAPRAAPEGGVRAHLVPPSRRACRESPPVDPSRRYRRNERRDATSGLISVPSLAGIVKRIVCSLNGQSVQMALNATRRKRAIVLTDEDHRSPAAEA